MSRFILIPTHSQNKNTTGCKFLRHRENLDSIPISFITLSNTMLHLIATGWGAQIATGSKNHSFYLLGSYEPYAIYSLAFDLILTAKYW